MNCLKRVCYFGLFALALSGYADPQKNTGDPSLEEQEPAEKTIQSETEIEKSAGVKTPDTFTPSEDISEDRSVSYPVDI